MSTRWYYWIPVLALAVVTLTALVPERVGAVIPMKISYQGRLTDIGGEPVSDGAYDFVFRIYDAEEGGELLWSESHADVPVSGGLFSVILGSGVGDPLTPDILTSGGGSAEAIDAYLKIECEGEPIEGATLLCSAPYSMITHRMQGDITTSPSALEVLSSGGGGQYAINLAEVEGEVEVSSQSSNGLTLTRSTDRSSPLLFQSMKVHRKSATDSVLARTVTNTEGVVYSANWWGAGLMPEPGSDSGTVLMSGGPLGAIMGQYVYVGSDTLSTIMSATPVPMEEVSFSMGASGADHIEEVSFNAIPTEEVSLNMRREGGGHRGEILMGTLPTEEVSLNMSHEGGGHRGEMLLGTLPMEEVSLNMFHEGGGYEQEIVMGVLPTEEIAFNMSFGGAGIPTEEVSFNAGPIEEVSFVMCHGSEGIPMEEIAFSTGPGGAPVAMTMYHTSSLLPGESPADTNIQLGATTEGAYMRAANIGGTEGDGYEWDLNSTANTVRLRSGGAGSGVYIEATSSAGGKLGINTESPSSELQVEGDVCVTGTIGQCSDARFKKDIKTLDDALDKILALRGVTFRWKSGDYPQHRFTESTDIGLVAQEVETVVPEVVSKADDGFYSVDYGKLTPLLVEALKTLHAENKELRRRIEALERR